jgi:DNA-binding PadR family transcriptional regulator
MRPSDRPSALVQGTVEQISRDAFRVNAGSRFPALRRRERNGLIEGGWRDTENNRRAKSYALTPPGRARLRAHTRDWEAQSSAIGLILQTGPGDL